MKNQTIIELLREGKNQKALKSLYESFPSVRQYIATHGGSEDDARDLFQEALIVLYRNALRQDFQLSCAVGTYLYSIVKFKWSESVRRKTFDSPVEIEKLSLSEDLQHATEQEQKFRIMDRVLDQLGEKCREILSLFYYHRKSMDEIAAELEYRNPETVKTQKYKCLERAKNLAHTTLEMHEIHGL